MPELSEVEIVRRGLATTLPDKRIEAMSRQPRSTASSCLLLPAASVEDEGVAFGEDVLGV